MVNTLQGSSHTSKLYLASQESGLNKDVYVTTIRQ